MGIYCQNCNNYIYDMRLRYCNRCGIGLKGSVDFAIRKSIPFNMKFVKLILIATAILCVISFLMMISPIITKTSTISSKEELPPCGYPEDAEPCNDGNDTLYDFTMSDGQTVSVDSNTYDKYNVGDEYTYPDRQTGLVFFLIPIVFFIISTYFFIRSVRQKRALAMNDWEQNSYSIYKNDSV